MAKIMLISNIFQNHYLFRRGLIKYFLKAGYNVIVGGAYDGWEKYVREIGVQCFPIKNIHRGSINPSNEIKLFFELYYLYSKVNPDIVLHFTVKPNIYGSLICALIKKKSISTIEGLGYSFSKNELLQLIVKLLYKIALRYPEAVFFLNKDDRNFFESNRLVNNIKSMQIPSCGIDIKYFNPNQYLDKVFKEKDKIIWLFIGRLLWDKGIGEFAEAAGQVKNLYPRAEFQVLGRLDPGNPAVVPEWQIRAWERQGKIRWLGEVRDVRPYIARADVVVLPSYREGIPRSLLEAMAMARPIITTDAVGCREVIEDGRNGFMVPVRDANALAAAMLKMIEIGGEARREMGRYGRLKAEREFDERIVIQRYVEEIERLLAERTRT